MTNTELDQKMSALVKSERKITREILQLIALAEQRRLPLERGFKDTYDWLIRGHGYSGGAANRRIQAARLLRELPEVADKVESGALNLTTLWQTQKTIRAQQKASGSRVALEEKRRALARIEGKTSDMAERELHSLFPEAVVSQEKTVQTQNGARHTLEMTWEEDTEFQRSRELLSHTLPRLGQVVARLAKEFNVRKDPLLRRDLAPTPRRATIWRDHGRCSYWDPKTGRICGSRFQLEIDHIIPRVLGGSDAPENLRCLCRKHNQLMAEMKLGREFMDRRRAGERHSSPADRTDRANARS